MKRLILLFLFDAKGILRRRENDHIQHPIEHVLAEYNQLHHI